MANKVMNGLSGKPWIDVKQSRNPFEIRGKNKSYNQIYKSLFLYFIPSFFIRFRKVLAFIPNK